MAIRIDGAGQQPQQPKGKGPAELAKALGITVQDLQKMSPKEVEKLAKEKGVDLKEYGKPGGPQGGPQRPPLAFNGDANNVDISGATIFG